MAYRVIFMATSSPTRIDNDFDCLSSVSSVFGRRMQVPAPQEPGFPLQKPPVNATDVLESTSDRRDEKSCVASSSCLRVLDLEEPRLV